MRARTAAALLAALLALSGAVPAQTGPRELVEQTTNEVLALLQANREQLQARPEALYALINEAVVPHFDFVRMSRWVLGRRYWQEASDEQKRRFVLAFRELLVRTYGTALLEYTGQNVSFPPLRQNPAGGDVTVRSEVQQSGGAPVVIDYALYERDGRWRVYDVTVEGVSLLSSYRSSFAQQIRQQGLDALIEQLEQRARKAGQ